MQDKLLNFEEFLTESKKWMQDAFANKKGSLHKALGVAEGEEIPMSVINKKLNALKKKAEGEDKLTKTELALLRKLNLAKTAKKMYKNK